MRIFLRVAMVGIGLALVACPDSNRPSRGGCEADSDCDNDPGGPFCSGGACVTCYLDEHCSCHERCVENACIPLASSDPSEALNAHGRWDGAPDPAGAGALGFCESDGQCGVGEYCNPFTGGCVAAADFLSPCGSGGSCDDAGPAGVVLACDTVHGRCLPAGLCWVDDQRLGTDPAYDPHHHCCDVSTFVCDTASGQGFCVPRRQDCTPPEEVTSACPMQPREQAECETGLFCSLAGRCVQCACDAGCDQTGGLRCYAPTGRCVASDFCAQATECEAGQSCDTTLNQCRPRCASDGECSGGEYCRTEDYVLEADADYVCRPRSELPCVPDTFESNQTAAEALDPPKTLPVPAMNESVDVENLTLCGDDADDWFVMTLVAGDRIIIRGTSLDVLRAGLTAYAADAVTTLGAGRIANPGTQQLDFTANLGGTYFLHVRAEDGTQGTYELNVQRQSGTIFDDPFESNNGPNNTVDEATEMNGSGGVPVECTLNGVLDAAHQIDCSGAMAMYVGDVDYYLFSVHDNAVLTVTVSGFGSNLDLFLFGPYLAGETVDASRAADTSTSLGSAPESVHDFTRPPGTYLVKVSRESGDNSAYDLLIDVADGPLCVEDAFDAPATNDRFSDASEVALVPGSQTLSNLALCVADVDWFRLGRDNGGSFEDLPAGERVRATLVVTSSTPGDVITLAVTSDETTVIDSSMSSTSPAAEAVIGQTSGGPHYVRIAGASANAGAVDYDLQVDYILPPACDLDVLGDAASGHNDDPATAYLLDPAAGWPAGIGEAHETGGVALCTSDDDWYRIQVPAGASVVTTVEYDQTETEIGLALYDDAVTGANVETGVPPSAGLLDNDAVGGRGFQRVRGTPSTTDAYIMVYNRTGWPLAVPPGAGYALRVSLADTACFEDAYEENDVWGDATAMPLEATAVPRLETGILDLVTMCTATGGELDWFSVDALSGDRIEANVYYDPNEGNLDLGLLAPGPDGLNLPAVDEDLDDAQTGLLHVETTVSDTDPTGDYLLRVRPYDDSGASAYTNLYVVEARVQRACADDPYQPSTQADPHLFDAFPFATGEQLALCGDEDWYGFVAPGSGPVDVGVCVNGFVNTDGNIDVFIYLADEVSIVAGRTGVDDYEHVTFTATGGDTYFVRVTMAVPGNQTYRMEINDAASIVCP